YMLSQSMPSILQVFPFVESDGVPSITLDNQRRFYVNTTARRLMNVRPYDRLAIAYRAEDKSLAVVKPSAGLSAIETAEIATSNYAVDKRYYMSARHFARSQGFPVEEAPYTFVYERGACDGTLFVFQLRED